MLLVLGPMNYCYYVQQFTQIYLLLRETLPFTKHVSVSHWMFYLERFFYFYLKQYFFQILPLYLKKKKKVLKIE